MRVVTTLPSATEVVAALGIEPVGVSHECDFPPEVESLPAVTRSRIETDAASDEIDRQVLESTTDDGVYEVDVDRLEALDPDLIVTQGMCDVCAVDEAVVADAVDEIDADPAVLSTDPHSVDDVLTDVERIGDATGREERAAVVQTELEERIEAVQNRTANLGLEAESRPRVAIFDWTDPAMIAGHWTAELVEWAGGEYGLADAGERSRPREWAEIRAYDPEVIVVAPCGFDLEQTAENRSDLTERDGWNDLTAVENGRVWAMDGDSYLNRPGPRLVDTLEALAPIVQSGPDDVGPPTEVAVPFDALETLSPGSRVVPSAD
ncbi:cobalamin-binding protein [Natronobacterium gregoryi]|uniref:ABC-type Fe3+-hydroxamate transport system, periplasmic component n=2 Tax=Natronobacterium gregoryi TaxID=44930 RepID=L0AIJ6_NATGS|nr:cobalamin-binding protein [Natronobacterium gregoryi]AFZ73601.1 ABC-type Fe3+-hydroxamate transport system, periplasmic component [Natronobacterium gregoryi SP2]ELY67881.1 periplasmic binding protein [Natronobacterium gregoryi SP2]PLK20013.1 cobalamin-binding protein [Natronobacterium gregoryi SP2]SFJ34644.1 iron complex transport system substrate-binding protein [Natronobacterium gregoryi]